jgi:hypothetical protein
VALVNLAKNRIGEFPLAMTDEEDVALSVFGSICRGAAEGRFTDVTTRDELWWLLLRITKQKVVNHIRREPAVKRRGNPASESQNRRGNSELCVEALASQAPSPSLFWHLERVCATYAIAPRRLFIDNCSVKDRGIFYKGNCRTIVDR